MKYYKELITILLLAAVAMTWYCGLAEAPVDRIQGEVYRIIFVHVPVAAAAFLTVLWLFLASIPALAGRHQYVHVQRGAVEVGLMFTILTLVTGSIWGRPTWGTWWAWDARLTTTLILAIMQGAWIILYTSAESVSARVKMCSILSLLITIDVPIIYKSVSWWRTLHQPAVLFTENQERAMSSDITSILIPAVVAMTLLATWFVYLRAKTSAEADRIESIALEQL